ARRGRQCNFRDVNGPKTITPIQLHPLQVRSALFSRGINAHFLCNVDLIDNKLFNHQQWSFVEKSFGKTEKFTARSGESVDANFAGKQRVLGVGGSESSFIYQTCSMDCDWMSEELVPTMLFTQYLSQCEGEHELLPLKMWLQLLASGPLWRAIRGDGLAYGANIYVRSERRTITLSLYRCAQPVQAYEQTKKIVNEVLKSGVVVESEFEAAKRSLICELMEREETVSGAGKLSIIGQIRGSPADYRKQLCERVWNASADDMIRLGGPRVANLFEKYARAITVHPSKIPEIKSAFSDIEVVNVSSLNFVPPLSA
ncbi:hypothetical protein ANCDUO_09955, partial [Ancylostoma duodenale]